MKLIDGFFKGKGWAHLLVMMAFLYDCLYWGGTDYAQTTKLVPSTALADLYNFLMGIDTPKWQMVILLVTFGLVAWGTGEIIEWLEKLFFNALISTSDIFWTAMAGPAAFILFLGVPNSKTLAVINAVILLSATLYWVVLAYRYFKKNPR